MFKIQTISPEEYDEGDCKYDISYGFHLYPFEIGYCLIGILNNKEKAICHFSFVDGSTYKALQKLKKYWMRNHLILQAPETKRYVDEIFSPSFKGFREASEDAEDAMYVMLKGTDFQIKVWKELIKIPFGSTITYWKIAENIKAVPAAVATAVSKNQIGYLFPCHRVFGKNGSNKYKWGDELKDTILNFENEEETNESE